MRFTTQVVVGVALLAIGGLTLYLAATQSQASVRMVEDLLAEPKAHSRGSYTLLGIPEPALVPLTGPNGTVLRDNPEYGNATVTTTSWMHEGQRVFSTHALSVQAEGDVLVWSFRNETRLVPADPAPLWPAVEGSWRLGRAGEAFPVTAFTNPLHERVWAWYAKAPEHPLQPKPSQLTGHLMTTLPDGTHLPTGAFVYQVDAFAAGCSSKFLPPEVQAKYNVTA